MVTYDAILVLDAGINSDATLTTRSMERVEKGVALQKSGTARPIIMSGGAKGPPSQAPANKTEAQAMKDYAISLGVAAEDILLEEESKDAIGNIFFSKVNLIEPSQWKNIIVVTSDYNVPRATYVFQKVMGPSYHAHFEKASSNLSPPDAERVQIQEDEKMALTIQWMKNIADGDTQAVKEFLYSWHPAYTRRSRISTSQFKEKPVEY